MLTIKFETIKQKIVKDTGRKKRPDKMEYTHVLSEKLGQIYPPESLECSDLHCDHHGHSFERDQYVLDILCNMIETTYECIPLSAKPKKSGQVSPMLPGWNETVKPLRDDSIFWHSIWVSAGRPHSGSLHSVMAWSRRKYHQAVKRAKRLLGSLMAKDLLEAAEKGDRDLMDELKKSLNQKSSEQTVPESLDGIVGFENILEQFRAVYEDLYNSSGTQEAMQGIKSRLQENITSTSISEVEKITGQVVKDACTFMERQM